MAIKNASDLLVYAKTTDPAKQKTRIRVLTATPLLDFEDNTNIIINNVTNASGAVTDGIVDNIASTNTGSNLISSISLNLVGSYGYTDESGSDQTDGDYTYRDFQNGANGIVPTLEITNGTATFEENGVIIEIITPGSSAIFDPVAFSTSASFSTNMDLRDVTNKDSDGWSESLGGLKSFEVSTDILQSINPDVPLDGTDFFDKLKQRTIVDLSFSDRIRNILRTNLTQSGVDGFLTSTVTQTNLQPDPFGASTASKLVNSGGSFSRLNYNTTIARFENKNFVWSFYVKGIDADNDSVSVGINTQLSDGSSSVAFNDFTTEVISGSGVVSNVQPSGKIDKINDVGFGGTATQNWTRVKVTSNSPINASGKSNIEFRMYVGTYNTNVTNQSIFVSSWQIELSPEATDYQDPTDITHWQGNALVSSVSFDAGVEDNLTCSATFTGTGNVYPNGLGPELIGDTGFDNPSYWTVTGDSVVENGYGKVYTSDGSNTQIQKGGLMNVGDYYLLEYTVYSVPTAPGNIAVYQGWQSSPDIDLNIPSTIATHKVLLYPETAGLIIKRSGSSATQVWLSSISLKKVL